MSQNAAGANGNVTIRKANGTWVVRADGSVIAESTRAIELNEPDNPRTVYFPRGDVAMAFLDQSGRYPTSTSKGEVQYFSVVTQNKTLPDAAWSYETPGAGLESIAGHLAFFATDEVAVEQL